MRDVVVVWLYHTCTYDERDVMSVSYMYGWMDCMNRK